MTSVMWVIPLFHREFWTEVHIYIYRYSILCSIITIDIELVNSYFNQAKIVAQTVDPHMGCTIFT